MGKFGWNSHAVWLLRCFAIGTTKNKSTIEFQIPAEAKYVALIRKCARCIAESLSFTEEEAEDVEIAVGEAVTNSIVHGRPKQGEGTVTIRCRVRKNALDISVEDDGRSMCTPTTKGLPPLYLEHGRGFILMRQLMEHVQARCTNRGLILSMTKKHRPDQNGRMVAAG